MPATSIFARRLPVLAAAAVAVSMAFAGTASALPGSGSVDANDLGANTVRSVNIQNGGVKNIDLAIGSIVSSTVANGSLTGSDIQDDSLTGADVDDSSLTGADVQDKSLSGDDVANNSITGQQVNESTLQGVASDRTRVIFNNSGLIAAGGGTGTVTTSCAPSERAIGATTAFIVPNTNGGTLFNVTTTFTMPVGGVGGTDITSYTAGGRNLSAAPRILRLFVTCQAKAVS